MSKIVTFIFDDAYKAEHTYAMPLFKAYEAKACTAVTSDFIGQLKTGTNEPYSNVTELLQMQDAGWEILSHGKRHTELGKATLEEIEKELKESKEDLVKLGFKVNNLVYPCHSYTEIVKSMAKPYYRSARGRHGLNHSADRYELSGIMIDDHTQYYKYMNDIDMNKDWLIFYCHLCTSKIIQSTVAQRITAVQALLSYALERGCKIKTVNEALNDY